MKNTNLFKTLIVAIMLLVVGVTQQAKADITYSGGKIYFADIYDVDAGYIQLCGRQSSWTGISTMSNIGHTKLYYVKDPQGSGWGGILGWEVVSDDEERGNKDWDSWSDASWYSGWQTYGFNSGSTYLIVPSSSSSNEGVTTSYHSSGATAFNHSQTVEKWTSVNSGSSYSKSTSYNSGEVTISAYKMTGDGTASNSANSATFDAAAEVTASVDAAYTGEVTLSATAYSGYTFVGWYDTSDGLISTDNPYTYNAPNETKTIRARFKNEETHDVTVYYKYGSTTVKTYTKESAVGVTTAREFTAPDIDGYNFLSYTFGSGLTMKSASTTTNPCSFVTKGSGTYELTVNYNIAPVKLLYGSSTPLNSPSNTAMTYDATNKRFYVDVTTNSSPYYFRFDYNTGTKVLSGAFNSYPDVFEVAANGSKVDCATDVKNYENKASLKFTGLNGSSIRIFFDYFNKKTWITETTYTISTANDGHGTASPASVTAGKNTLSGEISASPATGYYFDNWTKSTNNITITNASTSPTTVKATSTGTVTANFTPQWSIAGSGTEMGAWNVDANKFTGYLSTATPARDSGFVSVTLAANTNYEIKVVDRKAHAADVNAGWYGRPDKTEDDMYYADNHFDWKMTKATGNQNLQLHTAAGGTYQFRWILTASDSALTVVYPTSWFITIGQKTIYDPNVSNTSDATTTGGNVTAVDNSSNVITTGQAVANSASVTFTAHPATGYAFKGWYQNADCSTPYSAGGSIAIDDAAKTLTISSITADKAVYAKFEEIMSYISISSYDGKFKVDDGKDSTRVGSPFLQVGVHTTHTLTIVSENEGKYFAGWDLHTTEGKVVNTSLSGTGEDNRTITVTGLGHTDHILDFIRPEFGDLETIYFRNVFDDGETVTHWENVYALFDISWAEYDSKQAVKTSSYNSSKNLHVKMTEVGSTHIFRAYVPRYATKNTIPNVAFSNSDADWNGDWIYNCIASSRGDYNSKQNMFVPNHVKSYTTNEVDYYNSGYWMNYSIYANAGAGYYLERHTHDGGNAYSRLEGEFAIVKNAFSPTPLIQYNLRIDNTATSNNEYIIWSAGNIKYKANSGITVGSCSNIAVVEDNTSGSFFQLTPTVEGEYVITIDQSGDQMKVSVNYPIAVGDYILEHTYKGRNKANTADSTYTTRSNIIKAAVANEKTIYSMFMSDAGTETLKLRRCTGVAGGTPTWSDVDNAATSGSKLANILSAISSTPGVYQFYLTIQTASGAGQHKASAVDSVVLYSGNFYLKADSTTGGWVNYKNNIMDKNTITFDRTTKTFDNYWCHYYTTNAASIKCVIANDYCNQLSDTLKWDGIARNDNGEPRIPVNGTSIRFSYNSATNTIGRAYLGAAEANDFLNIEANATPTTSVYKSDGSTNVYGLEAVNRKFTDLGNWVYEMDLKVKPGGKAGVKAVYNSITQTFIPIDSTLLGGSGSTLYDIHVVYDFKTNYLMSAFKIPDATINDNLSNFDMLWVRHKEESAQQLTLGENKTLSNVRVVGAIELRYDSVYWLADHYGDSHWVDLTYWTPESRPYLKYFVSFPFDVKVSSIFGWNQAVYGWHYVVQKYNGAQRAADGYFAGDGDNYWENLTEDSIMHANEGYCVIFDNEYACGMMGRIWQNKASGSSVYLYFPAMNKIASISNETKSTDVPAHKCKIDRWWGPESTKNHITTDSHWNLIGSPLFHDAYIKDTTQLDTFKLRSFYYLDYESNSWMQRAVREEPVFKAMSSKYVQWCGNITWSPNVGDNKFKAARRRATAEDNKNYFAKLVVESNGKSDWTYVDMSEGADTDFVLREDMLKYYNKSIPQLYTYAGAYDVAYNTTTVENQTVPVGLITRKAGVYTFSMPTNFSGTVTLVDNYEQTRTNLGLEDYEVELPKGTINNRFALEFDLNKVPTAIDGATTGEGTLKDGKAHKFIMNDQMYILLNGVLYDAQGKRIR